MTAAALVYAQALQADREGLVAVALSPDDLAALTTAALAQAVLAFAAADRAEAAGRFADAEEMLRLGCRLSRVEQALRRAAR